MTGIWPPSMSLQDFRHLFGTPAPRMLGQRIRAPPLIPPGDWGRLGHLICPSLSVMMFYMFLNRFDGSRWLHFRSCFIIVASIFRTCKLHVSFFSFFFFFFHKIWKDVDVSFFDDFPGRTFTQRNP